MANTEARAEVNKHQYLVKITRERQSKFLDKTVNKRLDDHWKTHRQKQQRAIMRKTSK